MEAFLKSNHHHISHNIYLDGTLEVQHRPEAAAYIFPKRPPPCPPWSIVVVVAKRPHEEEVPVRRQLQVSCMEILIIIGSNLGLFFWIIGLEVRWAGQPGAQCLPVLPEPVS